MRLSPILTIFRKDVFDAVRDARVLVAILVPFGIGVFYNVIMDDEVSQPEATIVWTWRPYVAIAGTDHQCDERCRRYHDAAGG